MLSRSVGEIANLLFLFVHERQAFDEWKASDRRERITKFSPSKVRLRIEGLSEQPPISKDRYAQLSELAAHVHPRTRPQAHNVLGFAMVGAQLQPEGLLVALNELAIALAIVAVCGVRLLELEGELRRTINDAVFDLGHQIGGASVIEIDAYRQQILDSPEAATKLAELAARIREKGRST